MSADDRVDAATILSWLQGELDGPDAARIEHLVTSGDRQVNRTVEWLRWLVDEGHRVEVETPPSDVSDALIGLFDAQHDRHPSLTAASFERLVGELLFDSRQDLALTGTRGSTMADGAYRLAFTTARADVVLNFDAESAATVTIRGQILPREGVSLSGLIVSVAAVSDPVGSTTVDHLGRFTLREVPSGVRVIRLANDGFELSVRLPLDVDST